jgi:hypothetical protein
MTTCPTDCTTNCDYCPLNLAFLFEELEEGHIRPHEVRVTAIA